MRTCQSDSQVRPILSLMVGKVHPKFCTFMKKLEPSFYKHDKKYAHNSTRQKKLLIALITQTQIFFQQNVTTYNIMKFKSIFKFKFLRV